MMPGPVERVVERLAADQDGYPFAASYVAKLAGVGVDAAYTELEQLATRKDLERHFELISPNTGRALVEYRLGDKIPVGEQYDHPDDQEEPFVIGKEDISVSFSPTAKLRNRVQQKKKRTTLSALLLSALLSSGVRRIRSQRRHTSSTTMGL
jgi:hypothetical protein